MALILQYFLSGCFLHLAAVMRRENVKHMFRHWAIASILSPPKQTNAKKVLLSPRASAAQPHAKTPFMQIDELKLTDCITRREVNERENEFLSNNQNIEKKIMSQAIGLFFLCSFVHFLTDKENDEDNFTGIEKNSHFSIITNLPHSS